MQEFLISTVLQVAPVEHYGIQTTELNSFGHSFQQVGVSGYCVDY
jgi:hypothetical protein